MERHRPLEQHLDRYSAEDFRVWKLLFERQHRLLQSFASASYLQALNRIGFQPGSIPDFSSVNGILRRHTGWELTVVPGHVPPSDFFRALATRRFPATCWLRGFAELDYIEEPDMFHDVFGHVPLLLDPAYAAFMQGFGNAALEFGDCPEAIERLSRLYWFTTEFGLVREPEGLRIYGAGILSSPGETIHSMSKAPQRRPFDVAAILETDFRTDVMQELYFCIPSFEALQPALGEAIAMLRKSRLTIAS